ncbi:MAG: NADH-quinone oxidoreductase subunit J [bacterium]
MSELDPAQLIQTILICLSGGLGIYLMMPHRRGFTKPAFAFALGLGLVIFAAIYVTTLGSGPRPLISRMFFNIFASSSVIAAGFMITSRDPVHSALWFAVVVLSTSGLFLLAGASFLAAGTVIVYAGAIIVTFLFVIMLAQTDGRAVYDRLAFAPERASLTGFILIWALLLVIASDPNSSYQIQNKVDMPTVSGKRLVSGKDLVTVRNINANTPAGQVLRRLNTPQIMLPETLATSPPAGVPEPHVAGLGGALYTSHLISSELVGAILFVALAGAVVIATPRVGGLNS